jgi:hypothetical protein
MEGRNPGKRARNASSKLISADNVAEPATSDHRALSKAAKAADTHTQGPVNAVYPPPLPHPTSTPTPTPANTRAPSLLGHGDSSFAATDNEDDSAEPGISFKMILLHW